MFGKAIEQYQSQYRSAIVGDSANFYLGLGGKPGDGLGRAARTGGEGWNVVGQRLGVNFTGLPEGSYTCRAACRYKP